MLQIAHLDARDGIKKKKERGRSVYFSKTFVQMLRPFQISKFPKFCCCANEISRMQYSAPVLAADGSTIMFFFAWPYIFSCIKLAFFSGFAFLSRFSIVPQTELISACRTTLPLDQSFLHFPLILEKKKPRTSPPHQFRPLCKRVDWVPPGGGRGG